MRNYRSILLGTWVTMATWMVTGNVYGQTKSELLQLVKSYRSQITDMDVSFTYIRETLSDDPKERSRDSIPKSIVHLKQRGIMYFNDRVSWRIGSDKPIHQVSTYDGEKVCDYDVDLRSGSIAPGDERSFKFSGNWIYQILKWPQGPERSPYGDLSRLIESEGTTILPDKETIYGVEVVVLDYGGLGKVWLDVQHGAIIRKSETRQSVGGPLLRRDEVPELHDVNGVFLPARIVRTGFANEENPKPLWNTPVWRFTITIPKDTLKINSGFTKEDFQFKFPPDSHVSDGVAGESQTVGQ